MHRYSPITGSWPNSFNCNDKQSICYGPPYIDTKMYYPTSGSCPKSLSLIYNNSDFRFLSEFVIFNYKDCEIIITFQTLHLLYTIVSHRQVVQLLWKYIYRVYGKQRIFLNLYICNTRFVHTFHGSMTNNAIYCCRYMQHTSVTICNTDLEMVNVIMLNALLQGLSRWVNRRHLMYITTQVVYVFLYFVCICSFVRHTFKYCNIYNDKGNIP